MTQRHDGNDDGDDERIGEHASVDIVAEKMRIGERTVLRARRS